MSGRSFPGGSARPLSADREKDPPKLSPAPRCPDCRGPMPPRAWTGRPNVFCSDGCRADAAVIRHAEQERLDQERRAAERADRAAAERRRNPRAGSVRRLEQLQLDAWNVAGKNTSAKRPPTTVFGSTRSIRPKPATPQCVRRDTTDPALLRVILKVRDVADGDSSVVECGSCETLWQVPHYAAESGG